MTTANKDISTENTEKRKLNVDMFSDELPPTQDLPLDDEVKDKEYTKIEEDVSDQAQPSGDDFKASEPKTNEKEKDDIPPDISSTSESVSPQPPSAEISPEEKTRNAEYAVDLMLRGYDVIHTGMRWLAKIDESKTLDLHVKGKIDLEQELPIRKSGETIKAKEFFVEYNESIDENIRVEEQFKQDIKPPLVRICTKHNWVLTDELYVGGLIFEDLSIKISMLIGLKKLCNTILNTLIEINDAKKKQIETQPSNTPSKEKTKEKKPSLTPDEIIQPNIPPEDEWREEV